MGIKQLLKLIKQYKGVVCAAAVLGSCTILCSVGLLGASAVLISKAAIVPAMLELMTLVALVRFFGLFRAVFRYGERLVTHDVTLKVLKDLRSWYYRRLLPLLPGAVGNKGAKLFKQIINDIEILQFFYLRVVAAPFVSGLVLMVMSFVLYLFVPEAAGILLSAFVLEGIIFPLVISKRQRKYIHAEQQAQENFYRQANDFLLGFDAIWFTAKDKVEQIKEDRQEIIRQQKQIKKLDNILQLCNELVGVFVLLTSFYLAAKAVNQGSLEGIYLVMVPLMAWGSLEAVHSMPLAVQYFWSGEQAMQEMLQIINTPIKGREGACSTATWKNKGIELQKVSFSYGEKPILQELSFSVLPGEHLAVIGEIGSGKSTILDLLLGFYRQDSGEIFLDGVNLADVTTAQLGEHIAVVRQTAAIFSGSIRENLAYAAECSEEEMWAALKKAELFDFVQNLPDKLDYLLQESGSNLSGGQKKRLALAQLFLQDKPIILLDEVLEGLDEEYRLALFQNIKAYAQGKTMLYITHDLTLVENFDKVLEL